MISATEAKIQGLKNLLAAYGSDGWLGSCLTRLKNGTDPLEDFKLAKDSNRMAKTRAATRATRPRSYVRRFRETAQKGGE